MTFVEVFGCWPDPNCVVCADDPSCYDYDPCTTDACVGNKCVYTAIPDCGNQQLCLATGGKWDTASCGNWICGTPTLCDAVIPGCNCSMYMNFVEGVGCQPDPNCAACTIDTNCDDGNPCTGDVCVGNKCFNTVIPGCWDDEKVCTDTGGTWDPSIPTCVCAAGQAYVAGLGCTVTQCAADSDCDDGDACTSDVCQDGVCAHSPACP
jgi:hypothetical protein